MLFQLLFCSLPNYYLLGVAKANFLFSFMKYKEPTMEYFH